MADNTPNLTLPYIMASQAQKHVTHNDAIRALDAIVQLGVLDQDLTAEPGSPIDGDRYIVATGASGAWAGKDGQIAAFQDNGWIFYVPLEGWLAWVADENTLVAWDGAAWIATGGGGGSVNPTPLVGVNATADLTNRLSLSSPASLFNHEGAGHQQKINKNTAGDTASVLFQTGFSGRAEFGTTGDDDWHVKVSPDGSIWNEALIADKDDGHLGLAGAIPSATYGVTVKGGLNVEYDTGVGLNTFTTKASYQTMSLVNYSSGASWHGNYFQSKRSRGTLAAPASVVSGDIVFVFDMFGHDGATFVRGAQQSFGISGTASTGIVPMSNTLKLMDGAGVLQTVYAITADRAAFSTPVKPPSYTVATVPSAAISGAGALIYVTDEVGGSIPAFSDGSNWRRMTDRVVIS